MKPVLPSLSIVVVTHNRSELLKRALSSILKCAKDGYEIILCADDSSAETIEVAKNFLRAQDSFIRIPSMRGPAESRNIGAKVARGKWILFVDDDDTFGDQHIDEILAILPEEKNKVLYFNYKRVVESREGPPFIQLDSKLMDISNRDPVELLIRNFIPMHALVFSAELFARHAFDSQLQSHEDWDFLISLLTSGADFEWVDCGRSDGVVVHIDASSTSRNRVADTALDYLSIYRKWPATDMSIKQVRSNLLDCMGIKIDCGAL
ncbi:glycosyl transferase family 2 [Rhodobacter viridis]|uniref:Glycosyl transferase family 2 n=2 Tax=Rhodobacter viridis TaxID=1054202 RepID=A0A318TSX8_9RHOB|nr:glycosyl transferase family 2 [Rhodobacter viridis]